MTCTYSSKLISLLAMVLSLMFSPLIMAETSPSLPKLSQLSPRISTELATNPFSSITSSAPQAADAPTRNADASRQALGVVFPQIGEPFNAVFAQILQGIRERSAGQVFAYQVSGESSEARLFDRFNRDGVKSVIALGRQGMRATQATGIDIPVVVGGVLGMPDSTRSDSSGISLAPAPTLLFSRLKTLVPQVRRVIVIYNPLQNEWLIRYAREAARSQGLELLAIEVRDLASAARAYENAFSTIDGRRDAVWLPQDATTVDDATILPMVLRESWNRNVPVFSSTVSHARRGALFALYPDNVGLGRSLATMALSPVHDEGRRRGLVPLRDVLIAVNVRTAAHLGLNIAFSQQRTFDMIFPEP